MGDQGTGVGAGHLLLRAGHRSGLARRGRGLAGGLPGRRRRRSGLCRRAAARQLLRRGGRRLRCGRGVTAAAATLLITSCIAPAARAWASAAALEVACTVWVASSVNCWVSALAPPLHRIDRRRRWLGWRAGAAAAGQARQGRGGCRRPGGAAAAAATLKTSGTRTFSASPRSAIGTFIVRSVPSVMRWTSSACGGGDHPRVLLEPELHGAQLADALVESLRIQGRCHPLPDAGQGLAGVLHQALQEVEPGTNLAKASVQACSGCYERVCCCRSSDAPHVFVPSCSCRQNCRIPISFIPPRRAIVPTDAGRCH